MQLAIKGKQISGRNLTAIRKGNINKLIIDQLNINSLRNKFDWLNKLQGILTSSWCQEQN